MCMLSVNVCVYVGVVGEFEGAGVSGGLVCLCCVYCGRGKATCFSRRLGSGPGGFSSVRVSCAVCVCGGLCGMLCLVFVCGFCVGILQGGGMCDGV